MTHLPNTDDASRGDLTRFAFFPIHYPLLESYYQRQKSVFWTAQEIDYRGDRNSWDQLDSNTQDYVKFLLFLFAQLDGIVNENLVTNFKEQTSFCKECSMFYAIQEAIEWGHNETYSHLIKAFIRDSVEQERGLNSIAHFPAIRKIAEWSWEWMDASKHSLLERVIAFACVEGIIFSSAFAGIYWLKRRNVLPGLTKANEWIARDEAIHTEFAVALYHTLTEVMRREIALLPHQAHEIIISAVDVTVEFTRSAMNEKLDGSKHGRMELVGLSVDAMVAYIQCTADRLSLSLGYPIIYGVLNPFEWMAVIGLPNKTNFFESKVTEYARSVNDDTEFDLEAPF